MKNIYVKPYILSCLLTNTPVNPCHAEYFYVLHSSHVPCETADFSCKDSSSIRVEHSLDPDQMPSAEASWSKCIVFSKRINRQGSKYFMSSLHNLSCFVMKRQRLSNIYMYDNILNSFKKGQIVILYYLSVTPNIN